MRYFLTFLSSDDHWKALWALMPKGHVVHHLFSDLFEAADEWVINPLVFAVQISEDFVGKKSRLARRVHATQVIRRVLERSLVSSHQHWTDAGFFQGWGEEKRGKVRGVMWTWESDDFTWSHEELWNLKKSAFLKNLVLHAKYGVFLRTCFYAGFRFFWYI